MSAVHARIEAEHEDPRNEMLDAIERLMRSVVVDSRGVAALRTRIEKILDAAEASEAVEDQSAVADDSASKLDATVAAFTSLELTNLLTLLIDLRRAVRNNGELQARIRPWRDRLLEVLNKTEERS